MNTEPKPATGEPEGGYEASLPKSMQIPTLPKLPATGEWTVITRWENTPKCKSFVIDSSGREILMAHRSLCEGVKDAHNAALAAAWRKGHADAQAPALERIDELHKQLAAERSKFDALQGQAEELHGRAQRAEQQLAAEIGASASKARLYEEQLDAASVQVRQLQTQLAAVKASFSTMLDVEKKLRKELAAERDEYTTSIAEHSIRLNELREQLAAERENVVFWKQKAGEEFDAHRKLEGQLAAERGKLDEAGKQSVALAEHVILVEQLRAQLAAAQAALKLVKGIASHDVQIVAIIDGVLP
jgi:chromosome segregation ATPase